MGLGMVAPGRGRAIDRRSGTRKACSPLGGRFVSQWSRNGEPFGSVRAHMQCDGVTLSWRRGEGEPDRKSSSTRMALLGRLSALVCLPLQSAMPVALPSRLALGVQKMQQSALRERAGMQRV